jgi:hypothetical protein
LPAAAEGRLNGWDTLRRNCLLKCAIKGKIEGSEVTGRRGRRRKKLLDDLIEKRGHCKLKEEVLKDEE